MPGREAFRRYRIVLVDPTFAVAKAPDATVLGTAGRRLQVPPARRRASRVNVGPMSSKNAVLITTDSNT